MPLGLIIMSEKFVTLATGVTVVQLFWCNYAKIGMASVKIVGNMPLGVKIMSKRFVALTTGVTSNNNFGVNYAPVA
jgi:hypothetical protein